MSTHLSTSMNNTCFFNLVLNVIWECDTADGDKDDDDYERLRIAKLMTVLMVLQSVCIRNVETD